MLNTGHFGWLGALSFSGAAWRVKTKDSWIGWNDEVRKENLPKVVANSRLLILPHVTVPNLASHVLSLCAKQMQRDWKERYGFEPLLLETFVDPVKFTGTCYKASNWMPIGQTSGRRDMVKKDIYLYFIAPQWREKLCREPEICFGDVPFSESPKHWMEGEFGTVRLYDQRLKERVYSVAESFYNRPRANIPEACGTLARTIGAYRLFQNEKINMDVILIPHREASIKRIKSHKVVPAPQDTPALKYHTHPSTRDLGPINNIGKSVMGLILHDTVAFSEEGTLFFIL